MATKIDIPADYKSTRDIKISNKRIGQVIGQDRGVEIIKKASLQKRNVLLIGLPGTGKSMLAQAMAELLPLSQLHDILIYPNDVDSNNPKVRVVRSGEGKKIVNKARIDSMSSEHNARLLLLLLPLIMLLANFVMWHYFNWYSDIVFAAFLIVGSIFMLVSSIGFQVQSQGKTAQGTPKLLVDNFGKKIAPFIEATGARAGALLGDVRHDPLQSGGLGTPAHLRVEPGMIHRSSGGVLFLDEIATLSAKSQQELLTAMQEKKYPITGQSEMSSGAMTRTEPVPCDFVLAAAGNYQDLEKVHPALRSRIRGYGYEVYLNQTMPDNKENRQKLIQFVAQEIKKDAKIPHFSRGAVEQIIFEARRRSGKKHSLTLNLRDLGGLVRAAGDIAKEKSHKLVEVLDVNEAKMSALTLEQQMMGKIIADKKDYAVYITEGAIVGRVNGLAVSGDGDAGMILPIEAEVAPAASKDEGKLIATGKLGEIAKEAVQNVSAIVKRLSGKDISMHDLHIQFLQTYQGVEGDSASVSVATAVVSALERLPVRQDLAMTGSLSVRGEVLPVGGVTAKVEAAIKAGFKEVLIPRSNFEDVILSKNLKKKIKIVTASNLQEVLNHAFVKSSKKAKLLASLKKILGKDLATRLKESVGKGLQVN